MAVGLVIGGLWLGGEHLLRAMYQWLDVGKPVHRADYVLVPLGGNRTRPLVAAALLKAGIASQVLVPRTGASPAETGRVLPPSHEIICRVLALRGVPERDILIVEGQGNSTYGDMVALARFVESSPAARVLVVTDGYHTRRTRWTIARLLGEQARQVSLVSAPTENFQVDAWWQTDVGFTAIVGEYLKLAYYALRYGSLAIWTAVGAGVVAAALLFRWVRAQRMVATVS
jgi:uncharacterized SAM-binding protein YcdF (DUF218 family)